MEKIKKSRPARIATQSVAGGEKTMEHLEEELKKAREELAVQKWGLEKTLGGMKVLVTELIQKKKEAEEAKIQVERKMTEVERLNKVMIDRELKMVELKKEIEELKKK